MKILLTLFLILILSGCLKPKLNHHHHFVSMGIKDLPLILLDQDTGRICYAGDSPAPSNYWDWYQSNVGRGTPALKNPNPSESYFFCSDLVAER
jgi:hypothetical protein